MHKGDVPRCDRRNPPPRLSKANASDGQALHLSISQAENLRRKRYESASALDPEALEPS